MPRPLLIISQSDLIQIVDIISRTEWQTVQIQISWFFQKSSDLDLQSLQRQFISRFSRTRVKHVALNIALLSTKKCWYSYLSKKQQKKKKNNNNKKKKHVVHTGSASNEYPQNMFLWRNKNIYLDTPLNKSCLIWGSVKKLVSSADIPHWSGAV